MSEPITEPCEHCGVDAWRQRVGVVCGVNPHAPDCKTRKELPVSHEPKDVRSPDTRWTVEELAEVWTPALQITQAMLDAWPMAWECQSFGTVAPFSTVDVWQKPTLSRIHGETESRFCPRYLPGMSVEGIIQASEMTEEHFNRIKDWQRSVDGGPWVTCRPGCAAEHYRRTGKAPEMHEKWRPKVFKALDQPDDVNTHEAKEPTVAELAAIWTPARQLTDEILALWPFWIFSPSDWRDRPGHWQVHAKEKIFGMVQSLVGVWRPLYVDGMDSDGSIDHDRMTKEMWAWCWWETYAHGWTPITRREANDRLGPRAPLRPRAWSILDDVGTPRDQLWRITEVTTLADFVRELPPGVMHVETADSTQGEPRPVHLLSGKLGTVWRPLEGAPVTVQSEPEPDARTAREIESSDWVPCGNLARTILASSGEWLWREYEDQPRGEWKILAWPDELPTHGHLRPYAPETSPDQRDDVTGCEEPEVCNCDHARALETERDEKSKEIVVLEDDIVALEMALTAEGGESAMLKEQRDAARLQVKREKRRGDHWHEQATAAEAERDQARRMDSQLTREQEFHGNTRSKLDRALEREERAEKLLAQEQEQHAKSRAQLVRTHDALHQHLVTTREIDTELDNL